MEEHGHQLPEVAYLGQFFSFSGWLPSARQTGNTAGSMGLGAR
jgi:hypothetical protein